MIQGHLKGKGQRYVLWGRPEAARKSIKVVSWLQERGAPETIRTAQGFCWQASDIHKAQWRSRLRSTSRFLNLTGDSSTAEKQGTTSLGEGTCTYTSVYTASQGDRRRDSLCEFLPDVPDPQCLHCPHHYCQRKLKVVLWKFLKCVQSLYSPPCDKCHLVTT